MGFFANWLLSRVLTVSAQRIVDALDAKGLWTRLAKVAERWRSQLPPDAELLTIESLFPKPTSTSELMENRPPSPIELLKQLEKREIPNAAVWSDALLRQWHWVRSTVEETPAFFNIDESNVKTLLDELANKLELECQKDQELFQVQSLKNSESLQQQIESLSEKLDNATKADGALDAPTVARLNQFLAHTESDRESTTSDGKDYHAQIDRAVEYTKKGQPDVAIAQLEDLLKRDLDDRQRYRAIANIGHAYDAKEERDKAARQFIKCKQFQPADENARCLEAIGQFMLGNNPLAFKLAEQIRREFPETDLGNAIWIRSAPDEKSFVRIEKEIAEHARAAVETAFALSVRALRAGELQKAEVHARTALADDKESAMLLENLGIVLLETSRTEAASQYAEKPSFSNPGGLEEALVLLEKSLKKTPDIPATKARNRFYLGVTNQLLGKWDDAYDHLRAAHDLVPSSVEYSRQYALVLCDRDDKDHAIEVLKSTPNTNESHRSGLLLARLLSARNGPGDHKEAIRHLSGELQHLSKIESPMQSEVVEALVDVLVENERTDDAEDKLTLSRANGLSTEAFHAIRARQLRRAGEAEQAKSEALAALASMTTDTAGRDKRRIAAELTHSGLYDEALSLWKELIEPQYLSFDTPMMLQCAMRCGDDKFIIEFCAQLRANGIIDRDTFHLEIDTLQEYNCFDTAIASMQEVLVTVCASNFAKEIRLRLSLLGIVLGRDELVTFDPTQLPSVEDVDPGLGLAVVEVLSRSPQPINGVEYAYELLRRNFSSHFAHKAMVVAFLFGRRTALKLPEPDFVCPGVAVKYKDEGTEELQWYIVENSPDPDPARDEYSPEHGLAKEMEGKKKGETFFLRRDPVHQRTATIMEVWSKYKYRFNRCMEEWEKRFPEKFFLWRFDAKTDESGQPDFSEMFRSVDDRIAQTRKREELYRTNPLSVTNFAIMVGGTVLESAQHLGGHNDLPIRCCPGRDGDYPAALHAIRSASTIILDGSALATLYITGFYRELSNLPLQFVVSLGTIQELRRHYLEKLNSPGEGGLLTKHDKQYVFVEESPEDTERRLGRFREFLEAVESVARIEEGLALADYDRDRRKEWIEIFGRPGAETIALAQRDDHTIWTDDIYIAAVANQDQPTPRIWTQSIVEWAFAEDKVSLETRNQLIVKLLSQGYHYTLLTPETALWAAEKADWNVDDDSFAAILRWLSNPFTKPAGIFSISAKLLPEASRKIDLPFRKERVIMAILSGVGKRPDGRKIIRALFDEMDQICGVDVISAPRLKLTIEAWLDTNG